MAGLITGIVGTAISAGSTAASFIQAGNQKRKQQDFEADAARALAEARKKLQVNYAEAMSVNKEPYNQERLAMLSAGAQIAQAAAESERGAAAVAGKLLASQQAGQADIANRQGTDMQNIQNAILEEESRLRDVNVGLDVQEIAGQQQAAADARLAADMATQQGIQGIAGTAAAGLQLIPLFPKTGPNPADIATNTNAASSALGAGIGTSAPESIIKTTQVGPMTPAMPNIASTLPKATPPPATTNVPSLPVVDPAKFTSPEQAQAFGYVFSEEVGGYVQSTPKFMNAFELYKTAPSFQMNKPINPSSFKSPAEAAAAGYAWDEKSGSYIKMNAQRFMSPF